MGFAEGRGGFIGRAFLLFVCGFGAALPCARAQQAAQPDATPPSAIRAEDEAESLEAFTRGLAAYEEAQYEAALQAFEEAFRLGGQGEVQYNIAMAAERLGQKEKALAAYRAYLELLEEPPLEREAQSRIRALLHSGVEPDGAVSVTYQASDPYQPEDVRPKRERAIAGPVTFMVIGLAGLGLMTAGFVQDGKCVAEDAVGRCVEESKLNTLPVAVYGSVGGAFLSGGAIWMGLSGRSKTVFGLGPGTIQVKGHF